MMDNFENKLNETLKMLRDEPPDTLTNQVMAKIRVEGKSARKPFALWIGVGSVVACLLVVGVVFGTGVFKNSSVPTAAPVALTVADRSMSAETADASKEETSQATGAAEDSNVAKMVPLPKNTVEKTPASKDKQNTASRKATPEEIAEIKKSPGVSAEEAIGGLPSLSLSAKSNDTWKAWADLRYKSGEFTSIITAKTLTKDSGVKDAKKQYLMSATMKSADFPKWLEMAKKTVGDLTGNIQFNSNAGMVNVTVTFLPK